MATLRGFRGSRITKIEVAQLQGSLSSELLTHQPSLFRSGKVRSAMSVAITDPERTDRRDSTEAAELTERGTAISESGNQSEMIEVHQLLEQMARMRELFSKKEAELAKVRSELTFTRSELETVREEASTATGEAEIGKAEV